MKPGVPSKPAGQVVAKEVPSLLDVMVDDNEYASIVSMHPKGGDIVPDLRRALAEIEQIRGRPCICYLANVIKPMPGVSIEPNDDLPFSEMIGRINPAQKQLDVLVVTGGGSGQQVYQFVNRLRPRFDNVEYLLPYMCMSAGTLLVCSGDKIWMDERAYIGPIDPQVPAADGRLVPAQAILVLLNKIRQDGEEAIKNGNPPPWHLIRLIDTMDKRQVGDAISLSDYSTKMAMEFLERYKFKAWTKRKSGLDVTPEHRRQRAEQVAKVLCSNEYWKSHSHGITRQAANTELKLHIEFPDNVPGLSRALRRFWALVYYAFDKSTISKIFFSQNYSIFRTNAPIGPTP